MGSSGITRILVIKQNIKTKLNERMFCVNSNEELRNTLDINKTQYDQLVSKQFIDHNNYRYVIMYISYWMQNDL